VFSGNRIELVLERLPAAVQPANALTHTPIIHGHFVTVKRRRLLLRRHVSYLHFLELVDNGEPGPFKFSGVMV